MGVTDGLDLVLYLITKEPQIEQAIRNVLTKPNPTPADWQAEGDKWRADTYEKLVPDTKLSPEPEQGPPPQPPA